MLSRWFGSFREVPWRCAVLSSRGGVFSRNVHEQVSMCSDHGLSSSTSSADQTSKVPPSPMM